MVIDLSEVAPFLKCDDQNNKILGADHNTHSLDQHENSLEKIRFTCGVDNKKNNLYRKIFEESQTFKKGVKKLLLEIFNNIIEDDELEVLFMSLYLGLLNTVSEVEFYNKITDKIFSERNSSYMANKLFYMIVNTRKENLKLARDSLGLDCNNVGEVMRINNAIERLEKLISQCELECYGKKWEKYENSKS